MSRLWLLVALVVGACGNTPGPTDEPVVSMAADAIDPASVLYSCDRVHTFPPALLDAPATAESDAHPSAVALRDVLANDPMADFLPKSGYWLAFRDGLQAQFIARRPVDGDDPFANVDLQNGPDGWTLAGWGGCTLQATLPGLSIASWRLDPTVPAPGPGATTFSALVTERACASGQPMGPRLLPPSISYGSDAILVIFAARPLEAGMATCPSNAATAVGVELHEPLGDRRLLDASVFPAAVPIPVEP
jgi:hypothetical protein